MGCYYRRGMTRLPQRKVSKIYMRNMYIPKSKHNQRGLIQISNEHTIWCKTSTPNSALQGPSTSLAIICTRPCRATNQECNVGSQIFGPSSKCRVQHNVEIEQCSEMQSSENGMVCVLVYEACKTPKKKEQKTEEGDSCEPEQIR